MDSKSKLSLNDIGTDWEDRFWDKVNYYDNGCWVWDGATASGYGRIKINGNLYSSHRLSWLLHNKETIPEDSQICHKCDRPPCVNPDHLFLGNTSLNMKDAYDKGRISHLEKARGKNPAKGEEVGTSKLTENEAKKIKRLKNESKLTVREIADLFNISHSRVTAIGNGKAWSHI